LQKSKKNNLALGLVYNQTVLLSGLLTMQSSTILSKRYKGYFFENQRHVWSFDSFALLTLGYKPIDRKNGL
jgi:hypothetical protein